MAPKFFARFIKEYLEQAKPALRKDNIEIKTSADILDIMTEPKSIAHNLTRKATGYNPDATARIQTTRESRRAINIQVQMEQCINRFLQTCSNIGQQYTKESIAHSLDQANPKYDAAIIWDPTFRAYHAPSKRRRVSAGKISESEQFYQSYTEHNQKVAAGILAVIIVQRGECADFSDELMRTMSVRLICSNNSTNAKNLARILMGLFLFSAKKYSEKRPSPITSKVILELAGSYVNMAGFCSYSKFGFKHAPASDVGGCYLEADMLPMYCETKDLTYEQIFDVVNGTGAGEKPLLCKDKVRSLPDKVRNFVILFTAIRDFLETAIYEQEEREKTEYYRLNPRTDYGLRPLEFDALKLMIERYSKVTTYGVTKDIIDNMSRIQNLIIYPDKETFIYDIGIKDLVFLCSIIDKYMEYIISHPEENHLGLLRSNRSVSIRRARSRSKTASRKKGLPFRGTRSL